ncbi:Glycosyl transferase [uncultured Sporomusa sp.]|uniref:Glycosyl transferase n=1 Tax=uncultured Sporomusa sp. TaxID=307249 RepID=A0A212M1I0_9FIRM|nr:glycosyltransferase [uncultured Sporomusa sp.]SCM83674.1 Glycosyl transferase [uncultured Sporomusa sp.]
MYSPLVSIIIPVYNGANYLRDAIDSALAQTYSNCEVIVINDGSTDNTEKICFSYGEKIRYYAKQNGGVSTAVNLGIEHMRGDYFSWLSHDDIYYPHKVESSINALCRHGDMSAPVFGDVDIVDMHKRRLLRWSANDGHENSKLVNGVYSLLYGVVNGNTVMLHRSVFEQRGLFASCLRTTQDYDMWFRAFRGRELVYVNQPLVKYRIHASQTGVTDYRHRMAQEELRMGFYQALSEDEIICLFGNRYNFHYEMARSDSQAGFLECAQWNKERLAVAVEPRNGAKLREMAKAKLFQWCGKRSERIIIFGAGQRGKALGGELTARGIAVECFIDNNSDIGTVGGLSCLVPESELVQNALVLITPEYGTEQIRSQLLALGCKYWIDYSDVMKIIRFVPAICVPVYVPAQEA